MASSLSVVNARQLLQQVFQGALANAAPVRPLQVLQSIQGAASTNPLVVLQSAVPVRPLQSLQSQLPIRPLVSLQGRPGISWLQNSKPANALYNAAVGIAVGESGGGSGGEGGTKDETVAETAPSKTATEPMPNLSSRRRRRRHRRSLDEDSVMAERLLADAADELVEAPALAPGSGEKSSSRQEKALHYLNMGGGYLAVDELGSAMAAAAGPGGGAELSALDMDEAGLTLGDEGGNELLSRAAPFRKPDSPIYYIRLPPSPYVLVPGVGYVSSPGRRPLGALAAAPPPPPPAAAASSFYNLPLAFVSNGKPTGVYQPSWGLPARPPPPRPAAVRPQQQQQAAMFSLNKGPYVFNGRPSDIFILRDSFDTLYGDALSSFYP